ncbi:MAG: hypothetical protein LUH57_05120 [Ruminococcus sp.]|nr:hypothetical protein [Ruminococcus sp.]
MGKFCTKCGATYNGSEQFCYECGTPIENAQSVETPSQQYATANGQADKKSNKAVIITIICIAAVIVIGVVAIICISLSSGSSDETSDEDDSSEKGAVAYSLASVEFEDGSAQVETLTWSSGGKNCTYQVMLWSRI